jgi:galactokinase/mevalonate kinase-like predicted kinase
MFALTIISSCIAIVTEQLSKALASAVKSARAAAEAAEASPAPSTATAQSVVVLTQPPSPRHLSPHLQLSSTPPRNSVSSSSAVTTSLQSELEQLRRQLTSLQVEHHSIKIERDQLKQQLESSEATSAQVRSSVEAAL